MVRVTFSFAQQWLERIEAIFEIRLELRHREQVPLVLWSQLKHDSFDVLEVMVDPGRPLSASRITVATAEAGDLLITRIPIGGRGGVQSTSLHGGDWSTVAVPAPFDRRHVKVTLERLEDRRVAVEVIDVRFEESPQHATFYQKRDGWQFELVERTGGSPGTPQIKSGNNGEN